jgi:pimeloyl-ACP methyl ester carboxylesterase
MSGTSGASSEESVGALDINLLDANQSAAMQPITLRDGAEIQTWVTPGSGVPLLFLYGLGCSIAHWKYQLHHCQNQGRLTIHMDYRGHGKSTLGDPLRPLTIKTLSHDVAEVLDKLQVKECVVLGQSMGGTIAIQFAHDHPNHVAGLILQGSPGRDPFSRMQFGPRGAQALKVLTTINKISPKWTRFLNKTVGRAPKVARELVRLKGFNASLARTDDIDEYLKHFFATDPNIFYELADDLADFDITKLEHLVECPALILAGARDNVVPLEECRWLAKRLPGASLEIIPHGSHCPHLDDPPYVNRKIDEFLKTFDL